MENIPTLNEWKATNPGKSINDYFREFPNAKTNTTSSVQTVNPYIAPNVEQSVNKTNYGVIIFSLLIAVGFILPWVDVKLLNVFKLFQSNGYNMPTVVKTVINGLPTVAYNSIYLIPIGALMAVFGEVSNKWMIKMTSQIIVVFVLIYWTILLLQILKAVEYQLGIQIQFTKIFSYGFYLTCMASLYYVYDMIVGE